MKVGIHGPRTGPGPIKSRTGPNNFENLGPIPGLVVRGPLDEGGEYIHRQEQKGLTAESYVNKPVSDEAKLDKIVGKIDLDKKISSTVPKYIPPKDDDYMPGPYQALSLMGITKGGRYKKKKKEKFLDPVTGLGLSDDEDPDNWYWKDGKKAHRKRLKLGIICRGPGCNCKTKFGNKTRLREHYIEVGCYSCKRQGCMIRLGCSKHSPAISGSLGWLLTEMDTLIRFPTQGSLQTHRLLCHHGVRTYEEIPEVDPSQMREGYVITLYSLLELA